MPTVRPLKPLNVLGIMSGTSVDGVDYALCRVGPKGIRLLEFWSVKFSGRLRQRIHAAAKGEAGVHEVARLHHDLGRFYARHAGSPSGNRIDLVGLHGQTVFHDASRRDPATLQLGEPAYLAAELGVPGVSNFRANDLAAGGQGAPLATLFHTEVFARCGEHVCVNNLGGISNVTSIDQTEAGRPGVTAFDTGPANVLLDLAVRELSGGRQTLDRNGEWARRGLVDGELVKRWLKHPYFRRTPPKSTGREMFGEGFFERVLADSKRRRLDRFDLLATLTEFTAKSIALNYALHLTKPVSRVVLCGGGARNPVLVEAIGRSMGKAVRVQTSAELGWRPETIEAAAFALLAWRRVQGLPGNLPETTGATRPVLLGQITESCQGKAAPKRFQKGGRLS